MIIRSWICENSRCGAWFDSTEPNPACPTCGCVRVNWRPAGGHIKSGATKGAEAELRALADIFRMSDMNSAEEGRGAKKVRLPDAPAPNAGPVHHFPGGFSASIDPRVGSQCVPTANKIDYKIKATPGSSLGPGKFGAPGIRSNTSVEASHKS